MNAKCESVSSNMKNIAGYDSYGCKLLNDLDENISNVETALKILNGCSDSLIPKEIAGATTNNCVNDNDKENSFDNDKYTYEEQKQDPIENNNVQPNGTGNIRKDQISNSSSDFDNIFEGFSQKLKVSKCNSDFLSTHKSVNGNTVEEDSTKVLAALNSDKKDSKSHEEDRLTCNSENNKSLRRKIKSFNRINLKRDKSSTSSKEDLVLKEENKNNLSSSDFVSSTITSSVTFDKKEDEGKNQKPMQVGTEDNLKPKKITEFTKINLPSSAEHFLRNSPNKTMQDINISSVDKDRQVNYQSSEDKSLYNNKQKKSGIIYTKKPCDDNEDTLNYDSDNKRLEINRDNKEVQKAVDSLTSSPQSADIKVIQGEAKKCNCDSDRSNTSKMLENLFDEVSKILTKGDRDCDLRLEKQISSTIKKLEMSNDPFTCKVAIQLSICSKYILDFIELRDLLNKKNK